MWGRLTLRLGSVPGPVARRVNVMEVCPAMGSPCMLWRDLGLLACVVQSDLETWISAQASGQKGVCCG